MEIKVTMRRPKGTGCIYKDKRSGIFYHIVTIDGKQIRRSLRTRNKKEAKERAKEHLPLMMAKTKEEMAVQIALAKRLAVSGVVRINEAWSRYLRKPTRPESSEGTLANYKRMWNKFKDWLKKEYPALQKLSQINQNMALEYCQFLDDEKYSSSTYNYHIQAVSLIIKILADDAGITEHPFAKIPKRKIVKQRRLPFSETHIKKIFACFKDQNFKLPYKDEIEVLIHLACWTGLRQKDCVLIEWSDIHPARNLIAITPKKTERQSGQRVFIPIHQNLKDSLEKAKTWKTNRYILPELAKIYFIRRDDITKWTKRVFEHVGLNTSEDIGEGKKRKRKSNRYGIHSFRHSFVSFCAETGVPMPVVQAIVGHRSELMTQYYSHIGETALREAINSLPSMGIGDDKKDDQEKDLKQRLQEKTNLTDEEKEMLEILKQTGD